MSTIMLGLLLITSLASTISTTLFTNPIAENAADPWLFYHNGHYHLITTTGKNYIGIRKASTIGRLKTAENQRVHTISGYHGWAPEIHQIGEKWYLYYTACEGNIGNDCHRNHVAESYGNDPMGPYTYKAILNNPEDRNEMQIDPSLIKINGKFYLLGSLVSSGVQKLYINELSNPYTLKGPKTIFSTPANDWEKVGGTVNVAPEPLYVGNKTFVVYTASACFTPDYKLGILEFVGTDPLDEKHWNKHPTPVFQKNEVNKVYGPGHNGFFRSPDGTEYWIVYHATDNPQGDCGEHRSARAQKFAISRFGIPVFGEPVALETLLEVPSGEV